MVKENMIEWETHSRTVTEIGSEKKRVKNLLHNAEVYPLLGWKGSDQSLLASSLQRRRAPSWGGYDHPLQQGHDMVLPSDSV